jgi:hypothetical protein
MLVINQPLAFGALAVCSVALLALGWAGRQRVELMGVDGAQEKAQADQSMVRSCAFAVAPRLHSCVLFGVCDC